MSSLLRSFKGNLSLRRRSFNRSLGESSPMQASRTCRRSSKCLSTRLPPTPADTTKSTRRTSATHFFIDKSMQDLYEKIQNHSPQIVFNKYNHELVREKPYRLAWAGQSRRTCHGSTTNTCRSQRHLRIEHLPHIFPRQINAIYPYQKNGYISLQIVVKKYKHELVREKPSHCLSRAKSKNLPWLRSPPHKKEITTAIW